MHGEFLSLIEPRSRLLEILSDGEFHSGEVLGETLGVSRMAVWKHLKAIRQSGVVFEVVRGKGYRLPASVELLDSDKIMAAVADETRRRLGPVEVCLEVDSTNTRVREQALNGAASGTVCLAEMQHAGRGRRGRHWVSPFAANLYLSLLWRSASGAAGLGGISLAVGMAITRALQAYGIDSVKLKWPNDIMVEHAKLAGVLIDVVGESTGPCTAVIGIGLNVAMPGTEAADIDQAWTDLSRLTGNTGISRNALAATLLDTLLPVLEAYESEGLQPLLGEWKRQDMLDGKQIELHSPGRVVAGTARGIDASGALLVDTENGRQRFAAGEVSLRRPS